MAGGFGSDKSFGQKVLDNLDQQVSPIFSTRQTARFTSGARAIIRINNQLLGFAFHISWNINTQQEEIFTVDDYLPYEIVPNRVIVNGSLSMFHIPGSGASAEFIQSNVLSFMTHRYITIEVRDAQTNDLLFYTGKAAVTNRSEDIKVEDLARTTIQWKAIGWQDEKKPEEQETISERSFKRFQNELDNSESTDTPATGGPAAQDGFDPGRTV